MNDAYGPWAKLYNPLVEPWLRPLKLQIVGECLKDRLHRVLDVGSGTGTLRSMLQRAGIQAVGIDLSPGMLGIAAQDLVNSDPLIRGRGERLPFYSHSLDGVVLSLMLHENPPLRRKAILEEALRVLGPEGALFILDYHLPSQLRGKAAAKVALAIEWAVGGDHFRNYRLFMQEGALPGLLSSFPHLKIHWHPVFFGSLALAKIRIAQSA